MKIYPNATIHLVSFKLPQIKSRAIDNCYPFNVLVPKEIECISFEPITIFYGSNGCGKSTLLNVIGQSLKIQTEETGNLSEYMDDYVRRCTNIAMDENGEVIPGDCLSCKFIRSEYILNKVISNRKKYERIRSLAASRNMEDLFHCHLGEGASVPSAFSPEDWFLNNIGYYAKPEFESNGEAAMDYFNTVLEPDTLYLLDEPENSMSPKFVMQLARLLEQYAYFLNCQFIIATHSPFLLAMTDAKIYDLDTIPCRERRWTELENMRIYYDFFKKYSKQFEDRTDYGDS